MTRCGRVRWRDIGADTERGPAEILSAANFWGQNCCVTRSLDPAIILRLLGIILAVGGHPTIRRRPFSA